MPQTLETKDPAALDFTPTAQWPTAFPPMTWGAWRITGFDRVNEPTLDLSEQKKDARFIEALLACYPELQLPELARLFVKWPKELESEFSWTELFSAYGFRFDENLRKTLEVLARTPMEFQTWVGKKSVGARDLAPLRSVSNIKIYSELLIFISQTSLSKSEATQGLEWACELMMMGKVMNELLPQNLDKDQKWLKHIKALRFPQTTAQDSKNNRELQKLPWPAQSKVSFVRRGDQSGIEIRLFATRPEDLNKSISGLSHASAQWEKQND